MKADLFIIYHVFRKIFPGYDRIQEERGVVQMKRKGWGVLAVVLVAAVCAFSFREALMVRLFPRMVLSRAISDTFTELQTRFADSPMHLIGNALDPSGFQNVKLKLDTETRFMGAAHYDLELQTQTQPNRILGTGSVSTGSGILDLKLYLDGNFAALSSASLTEGKFYGITYDTFSADIREFPLLGFLAGEDTLTQWDASVKALEEAMGNNLTLPEIPEADIRTLLLGALVLKPRITAEEGENCYAISFSASGRELALKSESYLEQAPESLVNLVNDLKSDPNSALTLVFHMKERTLSALDASLTLSGETHDVRVSLEDELLLAALTSREGNGLDRWELKLQTASDENTYGETMVVLHTRNGIQDRFHVDYVWDLSSGDLLLNTRKDEENHPIRLNLRGEGDTLTITCREFHRIISLLTGKENSRPAICTVTLSPGSPVAEVGAYKNISDWSMEDLYLLLKSIGGLIGIQIP